MVYTTNLCKQVLAVVLPFIKIKLKFIILKKHVYLTVSLSLSLLHNSPCCYTNNGYSHTNTTLPLEISTNQTFATHIHTQ